MTTRTNDHQPEPCLDGDPCLSPVACSAFGYCRARNRCRHIDKPDAATVTQLRELAAKRKAEAVPKC